MLIGEAAAAAASAPGGCWLWGFAAFWMLLNISFRRRSFEVVCLSPVGSTSSFDILGVAVYAGTSVPLSPLPPSLNLWMRRCWQI